MLSNVSCIKQDQVSGAFSPWENTFNIQKQPSRGVLKKRCSENMLSIFRRKPKPKCDFNKVALHRYWNHTSAWVFSCVYTYLQDYLWWAASVSENFQASLIIVSNFIHAWANPDLTKLTFFHFHMYLFKVRCMWCISFQYNCEKRSTP